MICFLGLYKGKIREEGLFKQIFLSVNYPALFALRCYFWNLGSWYELDGNSTCFDQSICSGFGVESSKACSSRSDLLSESTLRAELKFKQSAQIEMLIVFIVAQV